MKEPDLKIAQIHKSIYKYMKKKSLSYEIEGSRELKTYLKNQEKFTSREFESADLAELLKAIKQSQIVYLGDFHTFDQSSKNLTRLIQVLTKKVSNLAIGVEIVEFNNQESIDAYINGNITELEFLDNIDYRESWHFPWKHYKTFFDLAIDNGFNVIGLNSRGNLAERDKRASLILKKFLSDNPDTIILVLFGEMHIVPNKLPRLVSRLMNKDKKVRQTVIHQNLDDVFWKIKENPEYANIARQEDQIIKFNDFEFSIQSSPPWIKYDSMIYWFQNLCEDPDFDIHDYVMEKGKNVLNSTVAENFIYLCNKIVTSLKLEDMITKEQLEDFNLYGHRKLEYILKQIKNLPTSNLKNFYNTLVLHGKSFKIPFKHTYYCSNYSINRISFLAGAHVYALILANNNINCRKILLGRNQKQKFLFFAYQCFVSYFSSKIINPYRKCDLYPDIKDKLKRKKVTQSKRSGWTLALNLIDHPESFNALLKGKSLKILHTAAKAIGNQLGDILYDQLSTDHKKVLKLLGKYVFEVNYDDEGRFHSFMKDIAPAKKMKKRSKRLF